MRRPTEDEAVRLKAQGRWVRELVHDLTRERDDLAAENAALRAAIAGDGGSSFVVEGPGLRDSDQRLPSRVKSVLWAGDAGPGDAFELRLSDRGDALEVMCNSWHGVSVLPQASNVFLVRPGRSK